jgi:hypothetical protein
MGTPNVVNRLTGNPNPLPALRGIKKNSEDGDDQNFGQLHHLLGGVEAA